MKSVMLGMSGGVDSSAAAVMLLEQGFEVSGVTLILKDGEQTLRDVESARNVADALGIEHHTVDLREKFSNEVIANFASEYKSGRTPNPCCVCNMKIKFGAMLDFALENGADGIATGHYAKLKKDEESGKTLLMRSEGPKDQSYFLYGLNEFQLSHSIFPLENAGSKDEIRAICAAKGLSVASRGDSQEICFVPDDDYVSFLSAMGVESEAGDFLDMQGNVIGRHEGIIRYTVGQRKGLGAFGKPMFVTSINAEKNSVILGENGSQYSKGLIADSLNLISIDSLDAPLRAQVKIRFRAKEQWATVTPVDGGRVEVVFDEPQRSVTPGQAAVFYDGDTVIGGARIISQIG